MEDLQAQFKDKNYARVDFPLPSTEIQDAADSFFTFLKEPDAIKRHIDFKITGPDHRRGEVGYTHRAPTEGPYGDSKDFFHFHPAIFEKYEEFLTLNPVVKSFMLKAHKIWNTAYATIDQVMKAFDSLYPGTWEKIFATDTPHIILRFLSYEWQHAGEYLAKPHYDAGSFTLGIAESAPGLRIGRDPTDLTLVPHHPQKAIFMISSNYKKIIEDPIDLWPGWHDVIQVDKTGLHAPCARWAIVVFIDGYNVKSLSQRETHEWCPLQGNSL